MNQIHKGRLRGSKNHPSPIIPIKSYPIKVPLIAIKAIGHTRAYILSCIGEFETELSGGVYKLWLPETEKKWPFSKVTLINNLQWLQDNGYIRYDDFRAQPNQWYNTDGFSKDQKALDLVETPFLLLPAPRRIPHGRLSEYFILARIMSTNRDTHSNICGITFIAACLRMDRHKVVKCLRELDAAGAITQESNLRIINDRFISSYRMGPMGEGDTI